MTRGPERNGRQPFQLDIEDMERHKVELRRFLEKAKRRFIKAEMPDSFDTIVGTILKDDNVEEQQNSVTIPQMSDEGSRRLLAFLLTLINKCSFENQHKMLQDTLRQSLFESVRVCNQVEGRPFCFFCSQNLNGAQSPEPMDVERLSSTPIIEREPLKKSRESNGDKLEGAVARIKSVKGLAPTVIIKKQYPESDDDSDAASIAHNSSLSPVKNQPVKDSGQANVMNMTPSSTPPLHINSGPIPYTIHPFSASFTQPAPQVSFDPQANASNNDRPTSLSAITLNNWREQFHPVETNIFPSQGPAVRTKRTYKRRNQIKSNCY